MVATKSPGPEHFLSLAAEGIAPPDDASPDLLYRWGCVSVYEDIRGAIHLAEGKPEKGQWIAILDVPDDAPVEWHPKVGRFRHRDVKADPNVFPNYVVKVLDAAEARALSAGMGYQNLS